MAEHRDPTTGLTPAEFEAALELTARGFKIVDVTTEPADVDDLEAARREFEGGLELGGGEAGGGVAVFGHGGCLLGVYRNSYTLTVRCSVHRRNPCRG